MTIQELNAVPIGGKVRTGTGEVLVKVDACSWKDTAKGDVFDLEIVYNLTEELFPVTEPQTWQEVAKSRGWCVAQDGRFVGRFSQRCKPFVIVPNEDFFELHTEYAHCPNWLGTIELALSKADEIASQFGGWA
jgi:hypothetical protein